MRTRHPPRRWRESPLESAQRRLAWVLVVLLHGVFALLAWYAMRPVASRPAPPVPEEIMQVRLFSSAPTAVAPPPPLVLPLPLSSPPIRTHIEPPAPNAMVVQPPPAPAPRLFDERGQPLLPAAASTSPVPGYVQRMPQGDTRIMQHDTPLKYRPTRFEQDWDRGGNAVDGALQKLVDKTTVKKTIRLPGGIRIHCAMSLAMLAGGCGGDPPPPPSAKDGDERLNMAPARSLDGHAHGPKPPSMETCIAMYRAGKPLAHGCPVNTPDRAVDAELRERAARPPRHP
ncbi:MAG: hypothetical protein ABI386_08160 [Rhodanobacter sp.]